MQMAENLDPWSENTPNHQTNRWGWAAVDGRTGQSGAPQDTIRCASHVTQPLVFWRFRPLELWHLGAPDSPVPHWTGTVHCSVRLWRLLWFLPRTVALSGTVQSTVARIVVAPLGAPDSPVAHRTVRWIIAECAWRNPKVKSSRSIHPGASDTVRWHTGQSGAPDHGSLRFLLLLSLWTLSWTFYWFVLNLWHLYNL